MICKILWMGIKWSHWQYLQDSKPNLRQKIISEILRTRASNLIAGDITNITPIAICDGLGIWKISPVGRAEIIKRNQLRQNGDLAGLDFVVNSTAYSVISRFHSSLESSCDHIIASWLAYPTGISVISSKRSICCISSSFEGSKANWPIRILRMLDNHCWHCLL